MLTLCGVESELPATSSDSRLGSGSVEGVSEMGLGQVSLPSVAERARASSHSWTD